MYSLTRKTAEEYVDVTISGGLARVRWAEGVRNAAGDARRAVIGDVRLDVVFGDDAIVRARLRVVAEAGVRLVEGLRQAGILDTDVTVRRTGHHRQVERRRRVRHQLHAFGDGICDAGVCLKRNYQTCIFMYNKHWEK